MAFDDKTRNRLQKLVSDCRGLLSAEFAIQVQQTYGLDPNSGELAPLDRLAHLSDRERHTAQLLRDTLADSRWQSLYHFTIGRAVWDARLTSAPAYDELRVPPRSDV